MYQKCNFTKNIDVKISLKCISHLNLIHSKLRKTVIAHTMPTNRRYNHVLRFETYTTLGLDKCSHPFHRGGTPTALWALYFIDESLHFILLLLLIWRRHNRCFRDSGFRRIFLFYLINVLKGSFRNRQDF